MSDGRSGHLLDTYRTGGRSAFSGISSRRHNLILIRETARRVTGQVEERHGN